MYLSLNKRFVQIFVYGMKIKKPHCYRIEGIPRI